MPNKVDSVNQKPEDPVAGVVEALHAVVHRLRAAAAAEPLDDGLAPMEGRALGFFLRHPGATASQLVEHSGRDKAQVARLVAALRERGLLEARTDEHDRRVSRLHPTAAAARLHQRVMQVRGRSAAQAFSVLDAAELQQLRSLLERIAAGMRAGAG
ncbi:MarR family transcriptional regulator [Ideonella sp. 4Y16]|uniref:MarR family transcriptional regulator n=1 Tax=Ideonella alba TaxID=2824118 RepID=A0A941BFL2_9BURK|nr:MarR family transcriptional regulator [Ideonella alba]MBQ0932191.1 MarR family transcriptional regulator [Ideonella alba]MBQ0943696.1 MarR family transcriptional regulator [Ideonella alba]